MRSLAMFIGPREVVAAAMGCVVIRCAF